MKKIAVGVLLVSICALIWYLFVQSYDFKVTFRTSANHGTINQSLKKWAGVRYGDRIVQLALNKLIQLHNEDRNAYEITWNFSQGSDSLNRVTVQFNQVGNSVLSRLVIPFTETEIERDAELLVREFYELLNDHLNNIRVVVEGVVDVESILCACIKVESTQLSKAMGMMSNYNFLSDFLVTNGIKPDGVPLVIVNEWSMEDDSLTFDFCYPIPEDAQKPPHSKVGYQRVESQKAIKAVYNGNYITSDRAWYALLDYAKSMDFEISGHPVEFFYNNPNFGGSELEWRAEVFLPIK